MFQEAVESWGVSGTRAAGSLCVRPAPTRLGPPPTPPGAASSAHSAGAVSTLGPV